MAQLTSLVSHLTLTILYLFISGVLSTTFTIINKCDHTVWPGILSNAGVPPFPTTGFVLQKGESKTLTAPSSWGGRFWGRTNCVQDSAGKLTCVTGDCGSGKLECSGSGANPPATLAEFTLDGAGGLDFFDVSLVDGYNLPMLVVPQGGQGQNCTSTGCVVDLNGSCPSELKVMSEDTGVACKSACEAFQSPQYCCSGAYGSPNTCKPSSYSQIFKSACPRAYSYAYDDKTSTFTCASADYTITFCPAPNTSQKSSSSSSPPPPTAPSTTTSQEQPASPQGNTTPSSGSTPDVPDSTMVYEGAAFEENSASNSIFVSHALAGLVSLALASWQLRF